MNLFIIIFTAIISFVAFQNRPLFHKLKFNAYYISQRKEWWRFFTGAFVHADIAHLGFNMLTLWFAGELVEVFFQSVIQNELYGSLAYLGFYVVAVPMSSLYSFVKHKQHDWYNAVGASGAVSAVLFSFILVIPDPTQWLTWPPLPIWLFAVLYLVGSWYMARRGTDNIGHDAHFFGALFGVLVTLIIMPSLGMRFINSIIDNGFF